MDLKRVRVNCESSHTRFTMPVVLENMYLFVGPQVSVGSNGERLLQCKRLTLHRMEH